MKCPNCGLEVVIATDMCPQCGYRCEFDGSILPPSGPTASSSIDDEKRTRRAAGAGKGAAGVWKGASSAGKGADSPRKSADSAWKGSATWRAPSGQAERSGAEQAGSRWTEAGVFSASGEYSARAEERPKSGSAQGLLWYNALSRTLLPLLGVLYLISGFFAAVSGLNGYNIESLILAFAPWLGVLLAVSVIGRIACGFLCIKAASFLRGWDRRALPMMTVVIALPFILNFVYRFALMLYVEAFIGVFEAIFMLFIGCAAAVLNAVYFKKREHMFR